MLLPDVNICLYAMRADSEHHPRCREWLEDRLNGDEPVGISELVLSSVLRISTNHRIFNEPSRTREALDFCQAVLQAPATIRVRAGDRHWSIFTRLVEEQRARGNDIPDAYLAALALESGATLVTRDRDFTRFKGLRLLDPVVAS